MMTNREAIDILKREKPIHDTRKCGIELCEAVDMAIEALEKVEAYETFIEDFVFECGYGDYSAMCQYMTSDNDTWCSEHCGADKPDIECVVKWSEERGE